MPSAAIHNPFIEQRIDSFTPPSSSGGCSPRLHLAANFSPTPSLYLAIHFALYVQSELHPRSMHEIPGLHHGVAAFDAYGDGAQVVSSQVSSLIRL